MERTTSSLKCKAIVLAPIHSWPQPNLMKNGKGDIQEQVVTLQPEFVSLGTVVCSLKFEMRVSFVMAASFTDAKETTLTEK